ncbi:hypothetical protein [Portibacter marinus]|uniref:hypothetical protein n=1 Tax=Portibacter marinus TaxID=2898660 RepID=UPI001F30074A|nr:hypothetical protein [Portibacter marinus]
MRYTFYAMLLFSQLSFAQFTGGPNDGSSSIGLQINDAFYVGGYSDGSASVGIQTEGSFFVGGIHDGFASANFAIGDDFYIGGSNDGVATVSWIDTKGYFMGGSNDGFAIDATIISGGHYLGGSGDGFFSLTLLNTSPFVWSGADDRNWNNSYNWKYRIIPNSARGVLIPALAANMPLVTSGVLAIGESVNGEYLGRSLMIEDGASLTIGINGSFMNYGTTIIEGMFFHRNNVANSFQNFNQITIKTGGNLILQNE